MVTLSNLCVDIVVPVDSFPSTSDLAQRRAFLDQLLAAPPDESSWEVGGNTNFLIAASRLGLSTRPVGVIGPDPYGDFIRRVLQEEGVGPVVSLLASSDVQPEEDVSVSVSREKKNREATKTTTTTTPPTTTTTTTTTTSTTTTTTTTTTPLQRTLACFVLIHPDHHVHQFISAYDFGPWPLLGHLADERDTPRATNRAPPGAASTRASRTPRKNHRAPIPSLPCVQRISPTLRHTKSLLVNGFAFDELPLDVVAAAW